MNIWSRLGFSVALTAMFCIATAELLQPRKYFEDYKLYICASFLVAGAVLWLIGWSSKAGRVRRQAKPKALGAGEDAAEENGSGEGPNANSLAYWGLMVCIFGVILIFIQPQYSARHLVVSARTPPPGKAAPVKPPVESSPRETVVEPMEKAESLRLQGLIYRPPNSSALINGRTYFVGDSIGKAKVVSIDQQRVEVEQEGRSQVLELGQ